MFYDNLFICYYVKKGMATTRIRKKQSVDAYYVLFIVYVRIMCVRVRKNI